MSEPISFSEQLRAWRQREAARAVAPAAISATDDLLPFRHRVDVRLEDPPKGDTPWLDWLRAEPWVPVVED
jgi:hypothetical protein